MKIRKKILLLIFAIISTNALSQHYIYQSNCFIGESVHTEKIDSLNYQINSELDFIQKKLVDFQPSYFNYVILNKKSKKPIIRKLFDGHLIEYYDLNNRLIKYTFYETKGHLFNVEIKYLESGKPYKIIEYFIDENHSLNGIFSILYDIKYNDKNELIQIESIDGNGYQCIVSRL